MVRIEYERHLMDHLSLKDIFGIQEMTLAIISYTISILLLLFSVLYIRVSFAAL